MRYVKHLLLISLFCVVSVLHAQQQTKLSICLEQGKKEYISHDYARAQETFERCLKLDRENVDTLLSLGGICLMRDDLNGAKSYFSEALQDMKKTSPYFSYTYSMLGDIALKQKDNYQALNYYNQSLRYNRANVNSLVGKGVVAEALGHQKAAANIYQIALAVEPLNLIARKRLISLEPIYFSNEEMLDAMKQRYAVMPDKTELSEDDRELFQKIHTAEQRGGTGYLKRKYTFLPADYTATLFKDTSFSRDVLTLSGYNAMQKQIAQDAIAVFQQAGVRMQDVFDLRDLRGHKIFLEDSTLTDSGLKVYTDALNGKRTFLLKGEAVPLTQVELNKINERVDELKTKGYSEINRAELALIKQQTNCSEETLRKNMGMYILPVNKTSKRYFVISKPIDDDKKSAPWYYVASYRARKNPSIEVPKNTLIETYKNWNYKLCSASDGELLE